jgi:hypothetical protein
MDKDTMLDMLEDKINVLIVEVEKANNSIQASTVANKETWLSRIETYRGMTIKQKVLIQQLRDKPLGEDTDRIINLINGLSIMMRDDAVDLVSFLTGNNNETDNEVIN